MDINKVHRQLNYLKGVCDTAISVAGCGHVMFDATEGAYLDILEELGVNGEEELTVINTDTLQ